MANDVGIGEKEKKGDSDHERVMQERRRRKDWQRRVDER
jgi:hypothetical protein